jgi:hypothetical protein
MVHYALGSVRRVLDPGVYSGFELQPIKPGETLPVGDIEG